jgi:hypothetical protein
MIGPAERLMIEELLAASPDESEEMRFNARAFRSMLTQDGPLSESAQRWLRAVYERVLEKPIYENLVSSGRAPRGKEVATPAVLQHLPKKPPPRPKEDP